MKYYRVVTQIYKPRTSDMDERRYRIQVSESSNFATWEFEKDAMGQVKAFRGIHVAQAYADVMNEEEQKRHSPAVVPDDNYEWFPVKE